MPGDSNDDMIEEVPLQDDVGFPSPPRWDHAPQPKNDAAAMPAAALVTDAQAVSDASPPKPDGVPLSLRAAAPSAVAAAAVAAPTNDEVAAVELGTEEADVVARADDTESLPIPKVADIPPPPPSSTEQVQRHHRAERERLSELSRPRFRSMKKQELDDMRREEERKHHAAMIHAWQAPLPARLDRLAQPRVIPEDPRRGLPPLEIELRQREANERYKAAIRTRREEFERILDAERRRLMARFNEYQAVTAGAAQQQQPTDGGTHDGEGDDAYADDFDDDDDNQSGGATGPPQHHDTTTATSAEIVPMLIEEEDEIETLFKILTSPAVGTAAAAAGGGGGGGGGKTSCREPIVTTGVLRDGTVATAGYHSMSPTNTLRKTFRPEGWKHHNAAAATQPPHALTPTPTPHRRAPSTIGGLRVMDGAVSDFVNGGAVRRTIIPAMHRRRMKAVAKAS